MLVLEMGMISQRNHQDYILIYLAIASKQAIGLEQVRSKDPFIIKAREHKYIQLFDSFRRGLNQEP